jgi:malonate transporter MadL subunit
MILLLLMTHDKTKCKKIKKTEKNMVIYGVALLSFCMLAGIFIGEMIGKAIGIDANVGGVGIAMLMLIIFSNSTSKRYQLSSITESGVNFWSAMYIPIVVAMAAKQNVIAALSSGWMAIIAGILAVIVSFLMIPLLAKISRGQSSDY